MKRPVLIGYVKRARLVAGLLPRCLGRSREESRQRSLVNHHAKADLGNLYHRGRSIDYRADRCMFVSDDHRVSDNRAQPMEEVEHLRTAYSGKQVLVAPGESDDLVREQQGALQQRRGLFDGGLTRVMRRLDTDQSPKAILDATLVYNQLVEGVAAIAGYRRWDETFRRLGKLPGLEAGIKLTQRDERRHIAYGTYLGRRIIAENPELWDWVEQRWAKLTAGFGGGYGAADAQTQERRAAAGIDDEYTQRLLKRRLEALAVARVMNVDEVTASEIEAFEPEELQHVN